MHSRPIGNEPLVYKFWEQKDRRKEGQKNGEKSCREACPTEQPKKASNQKSKGTFAFSTLQVQGNRVPLFFLI